MPVDVLAAAAFVFVDQPISELCGDETPSIWDVFDEKYLLGCQNYGSWEAR